MTVKIFLSHNAADKPFVRRLAKDLEHQGIGYWLDEAEIKVGESLIEKIRQGLDDADYVAVILSPNSIASSWVQREIDVAMTQEIQGRRVKVLPIMYQKCELPGFLLGKRYANFTQELGYDNAFEDLVKSLGVVFNRVAHYPSKPDIHIGQAIDKSVLLGLPVLSAPFHRPFKYMGLMVSAAAQEVGYLPNEAGNIIIDTDECHMLLEADGNFISFINIDLKRTAPWDRSQKIDAEAVLGALSINPAELELKRTKPNYLTYNDHRHKLQIIVSCRYDGAPLSVGFSSKYYGT